jgi:hypothetical protein
MRSSVSEVFAVSGICYTATKMDLKEFLPQDSGSCSTKTVRDTMTGAYKEAGNGTGKSEMV